MNAALNARTLTGFQQTDLEEGLEVRWLDPEGRRTGNYTIEGFEGPIAVGTVVNLASEMATTAKAFVEDLYPATDEDVTEMDLDITDFQKNVEVGQEVFWMDPDNGRSSGIFEVLNIELFEGVPRHAEVEVLLRDPNTGNEEVTNLEDLREVTDEDRKVVGMRVVLMLEYRAGSDPKALKATLESTMNNVLNRHDLGDMSGYSVEIDELKEAQDVAELVEPTPVAPISFGPELIPLLTKAESFISGFEDDSSQEGIKELLAGLRGQLAKLPPAIVLSSILDGLVSARSVVNEWEGRNLAGAVNELEGWTTQVSDISVSDEHPLATVLADGFHAAGQVLANWSSGDLAGAVQNLEHWIDETNTTLGQMGLLSPISVVWMSGGVVQDVTTVGDARVVIVDTDESENIEDLPDVPTSAEHSDYAEAKVDVYDNGREKDRAWAEEVAGLESISDRATNAYWDEQERNRNKSS